MLYKYMDNTNYNCPVCTNTIIHPRIYDCGHSLCEECMIHIDNESNKLYKNNINCPLYKCPICRKETHKPWFNRPRNLFIISILDKLFENDIEYLEKNKKKNNPIENIPDNLNLSLLCKRVRDLKLSELYDYIVPLIYEACLQGKNRIKITDKAFELHNYCRELSTKLFESYGIYKIESNKNIFEIFILNDINNFSDNGDIKYINQDYNSNSDISDEEEIDIGNQDMYEENTDLEIYPNLYNQNEEVNSIYNINFN